MNVMIYVNYLIMVFIKLILLVVAYLNVLLRILTERNLPNIRFH